MAILAFMAIMAIPWVLYCLPCTKPRGPGPLKIESTEMSGNVYHLTYKVQAWNFAALHGFGGKFVGIDASHRYFGFLVPFSTGRDELPMVNLALELGQTMVGP